MTTRIGSLETLVALWVALSVASGATAAPIEAADTVTLYVTVEDNGQAVPGLSGENFRVLEDKNPRRVLWAEPSEPASVVLLVENSLTSWTFLNEMHTAMRGLLNAAPESHSYALISHGRETKVEQSLTNEIGRIRSAYVGIRQSAWRYTDTLDAIYRVLEEMNGVPGRKVLIVIGSGVDHFSRHTFADLQRKAESTNVAVHSIVTGSSLRIDDAEAPEAVADLNLERGEMLLRMLATTTGGECYCPSCEAGYADSMREILDSLDRQYTVVYEKGMPGKGGFSRLEVQAFRIDDDERRDFKVRVRKGWRF